MELYLVSLMLMKTEPAWVKRKKQSPSLKDAICNFLNAKAESLRPVPPPPLPKPCNHKYTTINDVKVHKRDNPNYEWREITKFCEKCGDVKNFNTKQNV